MPAPVDVASPSSVDVTFAVIGDLGSGQPSAEAVADLVAGWEPAFIVGLGDMYYSEAGGRGGDRYDRSVGRYYCDWLHNVTTTGTACPRGKAPVNAFFTALGNHDISDAEPAPTTYLDYFDLPGSGFANSSGNERYYDFIQGNVHFFVLNSNPGEPDGVTADSAQGRWLRTRMTASDARWKIVVDHHPPYSSDNSHGSVTHMQWPFAQWGADVVLSGHSHTYERIHRDGILYFVNGLGGAERYDFSATAVAGSKARFRSNFGAQRVTVGQNELRFDFIDITGSVIDSYTVQKR